MKIHVYAVCWNESKFLPFFLDHYSKISDQITIFDNYSTDNSVEIINSYPNTRVINYGTNGEIVDDVWQYMKNNMWKTSVGKCDWVIVCDIDEMLYHPNMSQFLIDMKNDEYTLLDPETYHMFSEDYPKYDGKSIMEICKTGFKDNGSFGKILIFNPNVIEDINYIPGAHKCEPVGNVKVYKSDGDFKLLHYKFLCLETLQEKYRIYAERMSDNNLKKGQSKHYLMSDSLEKQFISLRKIVKEII